ncbi:hypothetical protein [Sporosarcina limicola]|uniref:Uncharacterized protein n=1 Tax=Sporosarcina limicola TaxID=34101 RepID=A0A927MKG0_9BACL|nr:hypothetical protein [Sporosarcina limicola]MBE1554797.1 hypothetical protein [Sporosarcina limicola]
MNYKVLIANGDKLIDKRIVGVGDISISDGAYLLYDRAGGLIFTAPFDSVIYIASS